MIYTGSGIQHPYIGQHCRKCTELEEGKHGMYSPHAYQ